MWKSSQYSNSWPKPEILSDNSWCSVESKQRNLCLTLACIVHGFEPGHALALAHRYHPFPIRGAINARLVVADSVWDASSSHLPQGLTLSPCHCFRERCQALHCCWTCFIVNPDWVDGDAGPNVLEGQVEALARKIIHYFCLSVHLHFPKAGYLIWSNGGHFAEQAFAESRADVRVGLWGVQVKSLLADKWICIERVAIADYESQLHEDPRGGGVALDERSTKPVVLFSFLHVTYIIVIQQRAVHSPLAYLPLQCEIKKWMLARKPRLWKKNFKEKMPANAEDENNTKCPDRGILSSSEDAGQLPTNFWQATMQQSFYCMTDVMRCNISVHMQCACVFSALISRAPSY